MEAREWLDKKGQIIRVTLYDEEKIIARREALVVDRDASIAVVLEGWNSYEHDLLAGAVVKFYVHPEASEDSKYKISGRPVHRIKPNVARPG
jgi:hypothetical protein